MRVARTVHAPVLLVAVVLTACQPVVRKQYTTAHGQAPLRTVGIIDFPKPESLSMADEGNPGMMFGAVGGLMVALSAAYTAKQVTESLDTAGFDPAGDFHDELERAVRAAGYDVVRVAPVGARGRDGFLQSYASLSPRTDLYLDVPLAGIGFESTSVGSPWRPVIRVPARLVSGTTGDVLYSDLVMIGGHNPFIEANYLSADSKYSFGSYKTICDQPELAIEGFRDAFASIAHTIGGSIGRGPAEATVTAVDDSPAPTAARDRFNGDQNATSGARGT